MAAKKRKDITREVKSLEDKGLEASQRALEVADLAAKAEETLKDLGGGLTTEVEQIVNQSSQQIQNSIDAKYKTSARESEQASAQLEKKKEDLASSVASDRKDLSELNKLHKESENQRIDSSPIQRAEHEKLEEIAFLSKLFTNIESTQAQLNEQRRKLEKRKRIQRAKHHHIWPKEDGQAMADFRNGLDRQKKQDFSAIQGESFGHRYVEDILGYETIFHGDEKSIRQGIDGLYFDQESDSLVVVEFKGQSSSESNAQKRRDWTIVTCQKIDKGLDFPYDKISDYERTVARSILNAVERGQSVRYEVVRTEVSTTYGEMWTLLEKQIFLEKDLTPDQLFSLLDDEDF